MYNSIDNIFVPISGVCNVSQVKIIDESIKFSDHPPMVCNLHSSAAHDVRHNDVAHSQKNKHYCVYVWPDLAKQQYYYSTGSAL